MRTHIHPHKTTRTRSLRVVQISDFHLFANTEDRLLGVETYAALQGVIADIQTHAGEIDLVLATGDISQDGSKQSYEHAQQLVQRLAAPTLFLPGNHDSLDTMQSVLGAQMPAVTDIEGWRIVALDTHVAGTDEGFLAESQLALLAEAAQTEQRVLVAMHHNPVPMGSAWLDPMMIANTHRLLALCEAHPQIEALVWGHVHQAMDTVLAVGAERRRVRLLACPATCLQFAPQTAQFGVDTVDPGYRLLDLPTEGALKTELVRVSGLGIQPDLSSRGY